MAEMVIKYVPKFAEMNGASVYRPKAPSVLTALTETLLLKSETLDFVAELCAPSCLAIEEVSVSVKYPGVTKEGLGAKLAAETTKEVVFGISPAPAKELDRANDGTLNVPAELVVPPGF